MNIQFLHKVKIEFISRLLYSYVILFLYYMMGYSIKDAILAGSKVEPLRALRSFTETDLSLSFHQIPKYFGYIAESLKWQATNIISEDFLSNQLCCFAEDGWRSHFCVDSNYSEKFKGTFSYNLISYYKHRPDFPDNRVVALLGPWVIEESDMRNQLETHGFILWPADNYEHSFIQEDLKYGTFRKLYPNYTVDALEDDAPLRCEYNTSKGIKYLKLLHNSYVERLEKTFDELPTVLLDMIASYVLGEFKIF
ncbi:MAG: hypothetical protein Hyperionvirus1_206 [Hyperionvirus sp.]|uniref:Uncharacterized protein n=1 Tax=Hyperionvirus sp. TaxID=2487770 RepID=A0A3G5A5W9_9VIRU|nr:MAG: hypothetical protein Hyperionvirus1_206 [Hyperionvirus sp.]